jgi:hypothetical protein
VAAADGVEQLGHVVVGELIQRAHHLHDDVFEWLL